MCPWDLRRAAGSRGRRCGGAPRASSGSLRATTCSGSCSSSTSCSSSASASSRVLRPLHAHLRPNPQSGDRAPRSPPTVREGRSRPSPSLRRWPVPPLTLPPSSIQLRPPRTVLPVPTPQSAIGPTIPPPPKLRGVGGWVESCVSRPSKFCTLVLSIPGCGSWVP